MKKIFTFSCLFLLFISAQSQNVGVGTVTPDASAKLDISSSDKGLLIPRVNLTALNTAAPITSPATGLMVYNTNATLASGEGFYYWNGTSWIKFSTGVASTEANNALQVSNDTVQLGGNLIKHTTLTQGNFDLINDLSGTGNFEVRKSGATDLFVSGANGNIGIGTTTPTRAILEQYGIVGNTSAIFGGNTTGISLVSSWPGVYFNAYHNSTDKSLAAGYSGNISLNHSTGAFNFNTHTNASAANENVTRATRMVILNNGNVGINNDNPTNLLDIATAARSGTHPTGLGLYVTASSNSNLNGVEFRHSNGTQGIGFGYNTIYATGTNANQELGLSSRGTGWLAFSTNNVERMRINGNGNIGVNTNAPAGRIDVTGTPYNAANIYKDWTQTTLGCYWFGTNFFSQCFTPTQNGVVTRVDLSLRTVPAGTYTLTINGQSSVLLNPIANTINSFYFPTPPVVTAGTNTTWSLTSSASSFELRGNCGGGCGNGTGGATYWNEIYLAPQGSTTTTANLFVSDINGFVGVNTKTPAANLEVVGLTRAKGNLDVTGLLTINNNAGTTGQVLTSSGNSIAPTWSSIAAAIGTDTDANDGLTVAYPNITLNVSNGLSLANDNVKLGGTLDQATTITQGNFSLITDLTGTGNFEVRKSGATDLFVSGANGNVGIGFSGPAYKLDVNGFTQSQAYYTFLANGNIYEVGDDAWISDINTANMVGIVGQQNAQEGGIRLGNNAGAYLYSNNTPNIGIGTTTPAVKLAIGGSGTNVYGTEVWVENNLHAQGSETLTIGGRGRLRVGTAWSYAGIYADGNPNANDLILGASSGTVRIGPGAVSQQNLFVPNGSIANLFNGATSFSTVGYNTNANGTAVAGGGNNQGVGYLSEGSGGAFTGTQYGVLGYSNSPTTTIVRSAGVFVTLNWGAYAYVGSLSNTNVARKIEGIGTVNTVVKDLNNNRVLLSAPEAPENLFEDYGKGQLTNGFAHIDIDSIFAKNIIVNQQHDLRVFIQLEGDCNGVFVINKTGNSFEVKELGGGTSNTPFTYHIIANRADEVLEDGTISRYSMERFAPAIGPQKMITMERTEK